MLLIKIIFELKMYSKGKCDIHRPTDRQMHTCNNTFTLSNNQIVYIFF